MLIYKRILLKLSGEFFSSNTQKLGINKLANLIKHLQQLLDHKVQIVIVVGGGNIVRGDQWLLQAKQSYQNINPAIADYIGMMATIINGLALHSCCQAQGIDSILISPYNIDNVIDQTYEKSTAIQSLQQNKILIIAGGTGKPFCTTDTAASFFGVELEVDVLLKATKVNGIFSADPLQNTTAKFLSQITYEQAIAQKLNVMDQQAFTHCKQHSLPIIIFNMQKIQAILSIVQGKKIGSLICN